MKSLYTVAILLGITLLYPNITHSQCNIAKYEKQCIADIQGRGFAYLKSYQLNNKTKSTYQYVFSAGAKYLITIEDAKKGADISFKIIDSRGKQVFTNYVNGKYHNKVIYQCGRPGVYKLIFESRKAACAAGVLAFKR